MRKFLLPFLFSILLFLPLAAAEKGVGIMWSTQTEIVQEAQSHCVSYGVYNPFSEDANIYLTASGDLAPLVVDSQPILVPAGTTHDKAIQVSLCFNVPKVYTQTCTSGIVCEQSCNESQKVYDGDVIAALKSDATASGATGSATKGVASAPLTLKVSCEAKEKNWAPLIALAVVLLAFFGFAATRKRKR